MYSALRFVVQFAFVTCLVRSQAEDVCYTPTQEEGRCVLLDNCDKLKSLVHTSRETLMKYHCGWEGSAPQVIPKVCCTSRVTATSSTELPPKACVTLKGTFGSCVPLSSCPFIADMLKTKTAQAIDYFQRSRCIGPGDRNVCCDNLVLNTGVVDRDGTCPPTAYPEDPSSQCCGVESFSGNKIYGGQDAAIDQYPWLALLEYTRPLVCGGSLISNKYVLTAAHCILSKANKPLGVTGVILGEYNTKNEGPDCVPTEGGGRDCTIGAERVAVEAAIPHPEYNTHSIVQYVHDIALLRLVKMVTFNDFIKPICLPTSDITIRAPKNLTFFVSGWGAVNITQRTSDIKQYTNLTFVDSQRCQAAFLTSKGPLVWDNQICAGGEEGKDTCKGDSGGPLMYEYDKFQVLSGIVSFGLLQCGTSKPSVYTNVYYYRSWILNTIKP